MALAGPGPSAAQPAALVGPGPSAQPAALAGPGPSAQPAALAGPGPSAQKAPPAVAHNGVASAAAATSEDTLYVAPEILVEAPRYFPEWEAAFRHSGFVSVLHLGDKKARVGDLSTVLSEMVGIRVRQYGGLGSFATVSIRGSSSNHVLVYLDGMPLNDAYLGTANLADFPLDGIERIEIFRGFTPAELGESAIGGAINLVTVDPGVWSGGGRGPRVEARESYGAFGTHRHQLSLWAGLSKLRGFFHGGYLGSRGDYGFVDDQGTPYNAADDVETTRINNDFASWNLIGRLDADIPPAGSLAVSHDTFVRRQGVPGLGFYQSSTARSERSRHASQLRWKSRPWLSGAVRPSASIYYSTTNEKFHDPNGEIGLTKQDTNNEMEMAGGSVRAVFDPPVLPVSFDVFFEGRKERFHPGVNLPSPSSGPDRRRSSRTLALSAELFLLDRRLVLSAAERFQAHTNEFYDAARFPWLPPSPQGKIHRSNQSPSVGARWQAAPFLVVKGNWGRVERLPTFLELFGNVGSVTGNANLVPENGLNRDIGMVLSADRLGFVRRLFVEAVYIDNKIEDLILFFPNSQHTARPQNIGSARIRGWEVSYSGMLGRLLRLSGNYTRLDSRDTGPIPYYHGNRLASRPEHEIAQSAELVLRRWKLSYEYQLIGANYLDPANQREIPARHIHSAAVHVKVPVRGVSVTMEGRNLSDDRISDVSGFPLPGRSLYATMIYER